MNKKFILSLFFTLFAFWIQAQDVITKVDGTVISPVKIIKVTKSTLTYLYGDNPNEKNEEIDKVAYFQQDGKRYDYNPMAPMSTAAQGPANSVQYLPNGDAVPVQAAMTTEQLYVQGQSDALRHYRGYKGAGGGTLAATLLTNALFGLIPAIACSATPPNQGNLMYPDNNLFTNNAAYANGYRAKAHQMKRGKVWLNWGIGSLVSTVVLVAISSK